MQCFMFQVIRFDAFTIVVKQIVADNATLTTATSPDWNRYLVSYCVIIIATLPVLIAMPFAQKQLQKGSLMGAVKE